MADKWAQYAETAKDAPAPPSADKWSKYAEEKPGAASRFGTNYYETTVGPLVETVKHPWEAVKGMVNVPRMEEIAKHIQAGDYGKAALSIGQYATETPAQRMGTQMVGDVAHDVKEENYAGAMGRVLGDATMLVGGNVAEAAPRAIRSAAPVVRAGVKAAYPDIVKGAGMIAGAEAMSQVPGMAYPAHMALAYPAAKSITAGMTKGFKAGKAVLTERARLSKLKADAAKMPQEVMDEMLRDSEMPEPPVPEPMQAPQGQPIPRPAPRWEDAAAIERLQADQAARAGSPAAHPVEPSAVPPSGAEPPQPVAVEPPVPTPAIPEVAAEAPKGLPPNPQQMTRPQMDALTSDQIAEMLFKEGRQSGTFPDEAPPEVNPFEVKARALKVKKLADALNNAGQGYDVMSKLPGPQLKATVQAAAEMIGEKSFSPESIADLMQELGKRPKAKQVSPVAPPVEPAASGKLGVKPKRTTVFDYLNEPVNYGGQQVSRGDMIKDLQSKGATQGQINAYLGGRDTASAKATETAPKETAPQSQAKKPAGRAAKAATKGK